MRGCRLFSLTVLIEYPSLMTIATVTEVDNEGESERFCEIKINKSGIPKFAAHFSPSRSLLIKTFSR